MRDFASAAWQTCEQMHLLMLDDDQPENEKQRLDPDHWYEINLTNAMLFANLTLDGLPQLVPGRLFSTRMSRNIVKDPGERMDFIKKCRKNDLRCICVLTESEEFEKYPGFLPRGVRISRPQSRNSRLQDSNRRRPDEQH